MSSFALAADDDAPAWVFDSTIHLVEGGWEPEETVSRSADRPRWTRQQRRIYHRAQTVIQRHEGNSNPGVWVMLSSSDKSDPSKMAEHHRQLRKLVVQRVGGKLHHFTVQTAEGENVAPEHRGVLHVLWFWERPTGCRKSMLWVDQRWLSDTWERLHGARYVWIKPYRPGHTSRNRVSRYVVTQYVTGQSALVRYSWSWRLTFAVPIVALWRRFRNAHGGPMSGIIASWGRILHGDTVTVHGQAWSLAPP